MIIAAKTLYAIVVTVAFVVILYYLEEGHWPWEGTS